MFKNLGIGVGLRPPYFDVFLKKKPKSVQWLEIISENYMQGQLGFSPTRRLEKLLQIRQDYQVVMHGISMNLGSSDKLDKAYLRRLKDLVKLVEPPYISDHLCFTGVDGKNYHDLLPLPYMQESMDLVVDKIKFVQDYIQLPFLLENVSSYISFPESSFTEWDFISEVVQRADCGLLLDINNVFVSAQNHNFNPVQYLKRIPLERVGQIHMAGHLESEHQSTRGILIDTHGENIRPEVWSLFEFVTESHSEISVMIERDSNLPAWSELEQELMKLKNIQDRQRNIDHVHL